MRPHMTVAMKKTLFITMLTAALLGGGSAFAGTVVEGYDENMSDVPDWIYGSYDDISATKGDIRISEGAESEGYNELGVVCGGHAEHSDGLGVFTYADENTVIMTGGVVRNAIYGGEAKGGIARASSNLVIVAGGTVGGVYGGYTGTATEGTTGAYGNKIVVTGGTIAWVSPGPSTQFSERNSVDIVGTGASYTHNQETFTGKEISIGTVSMSTRWVEPSRLEDNSLNITGKDIKIGSVGTGFQLLNFHLLADQLTSTDPMVTITEENGFSLTEGLALSFDALDNMEWEPGDSVTLVEAQKGMGIAPEVLDKEYNIYRNGDPAKTVMATAKLELVQEQGTTQLLKLTFQGVPEPTTGSLGLFALVGLCMRKRRK